MLKLNIEYKSIDSMIVAIVLQATMISTTLALGFNIQSGANAIVLCAILLLLMIRIISKKQVRINFDYRIVLMLSLVMFLFVCSYLFSPYKVDYSIVQLVFYAILPIVCMSLEFNVQKVLTYGLYISIFTVFARGKHFAYIYEYMHQADMGYIYPILTSLIIALFHFKFYRKNSGILVNICYAYNFYLLIKTLMVANRGAFIGVFCTIFVLLIHELDADGNLKIAKGKRFVTLFITVIVVVIVAVNLQAVLLMLTELCANVFGYVPSFLLKMNRYIQFDDLSNGRTPIYICWWKGFSSSPIWGSGIRTFENYCGYAYPHNYIIQFLYEGGILFAVFPVYYGIKILIGTLFGKYHDKNTAIMAGMLVCQCYPKLLLSTDAWMGTALWMMIAFSAVNYYGDKE